MACEGMIPVLFEKSNCLIVVPTFNEEAAIQDCLMSLLSQSTGCDVVVVDGNSTDRTQSIVLNMAKSFDNLKLLTNPNRIQSAGINLAVEHHAQDHHSVLIRCDAHSLYPNDFIDQILKTFQTQDVGSVVVPMIANGANGFAKAAAWIVDSWLGNGGAKHRGGAYSGLVDHGHHAGIRMDWFLRLGGYDASFAHNEDAEYDLRLARCGGVIWMNGAIPIQYQMRPSLRSIAKQYFLYGRGRARTVLKHQQILKLRQILPVVNFSALIALTAGAAFWPLLGGGVLAYGVILGLVSVLGAVRLRSLSGLWAGPALGAMHHAWAVGFLRQRIAG